MTLPHPQRFSLGSTLLFITTLCASAGWWGANQRTERAIREAVQLRMQLTQYQAELGELSVIDTAKVHAIGLRMRPEDRGRWKWRIYVPPGRTWQLLLVDSPAALDRNGVQAQLRGDQAGSSPLAAPVSAGEFVLEAVIIPPGDDTRPSYLACAINGQRCAELPLSGVDWVAAYDSRFSVGPNDRSVWEPGEQALLLALSPAGAAADQDAQMLAIWLWESSPPEPGEAWSPATR
jgi:hypothetical protein